MTPRRRSCALPTCLRCRRVFMGHSITSTALSKTEGDRPRPHCGSMACSAVANSVSPRLFSASFGRGGATFAWLGTRPHLLYIETPPTWCHRRSIFVPGSLRARPPVGRPCNAPLLPFVFRHAPKFTLCKRLRARRGKWKTPPSFLRSLPRRANRRTNEVC